MTKRDRVREPVYGWSVGLDAPTVRDVIAQVQQGFSVTVLNEFRRMLGLDLDGAADLLGASSRTLARRQKQGRLLETESDRLYRITRLYERAVEVFGNEADAQVWFHRPQWGLGGDTPLRYARTEPGAREVEALLDRIDYGVMP
jgi:putative toxin-antitoxin system antitoxin component (TIGR02293 family)